MAGYFEIIEKKCRNCFKTKLVSEFRTRKISKDGYRNQCKECVRFKQKNYYIKNKENRKAKNKLWRLQNKNKLKKNMEKFNLMNPNYQKKYALENREKINERNKKRRDSNDFFKLKENIRTLIKNSITYKGVKKNQKSVKILGFSFEEFKLYLESKFESWMNWENYGNPKDGMLEPNKTWDIDHIIPLSSVKTEEDVIKLNHYSNLQPLCSYYNRITKRAKIV